MLLRCWIRAVHSPTELIKDVLEQKLDDRELIAATEMLGEIADPQVSMPVIRHQLENSRVLVREAALVAISVFSVGHSGFEFDLTIRDAILKVAHDDESPSLRLVAIEIFRDLKFEKAGPVEYKQQMKNSVELQGTYGGDETHALSAWTSTSRDLTDEKRGRMDKLLLRLASEGHETPFEKSVQHFLVTTDIATHIHLLKHRIGVSINGESARYKELKDDKFYVPVDWDEEEQAEYIEFMELALSKYHKVLARLKAKGFSARRAKEAARFYLPYGNQITADIMFNFRSFAHFVRLRYSMHAQLEVRNLTRTMLEQVLETGKFNMTFEAFGLLDENGQLMPPFDSEDK